jgi:hypothetical protein
MEGMPRDNTPDPDLVQRWVDTWSRAGVQLESIRRTEIESSDTQEAVRQIFGNIERASGLGPPTSGLVHQQAWFARIRLVHGERNERAL